MSLSVAVIDLRLRRQRRQRRAFSRLQFDLNAGSARLAHARASLVGRGDDDEQIVLGPTAFAYLSCDVGVGGVAVFDLEVVLGDVVDVDRRTVAAVCVVANAFEQRRGIVDAHRQRRSRAAYRDIFVGGVEFVHGEVVIHSARYGGGRRIRELERRRAVHLLVGALGVVSLIGECVEDVAARRSLPVCRIAARVERAVEHSLFRPRAVGRGGRDVERRLQDVERQRRALPFGYYDVVVLVEVGVCRRHLALIVDDLLSRTESVGAREHRVVAGDLRRPALIEPGIRSRLDGNRFARRGQGQRRFVDGRAVIHHSAEVPAALLIGDAVLRHRAEDDLVRGLLTGEADQIDHCAYPARVILQRHLLHGRFAFDRLTSLERPNELAGITGGQLLIGRRIPDVFERLIGVRSHEVFRCRLDTEAAVRYFDLDGDVGAAARIIDLRPILDAAGVAHTLLLVSAAQAGIQTVIVVRQRDRQSALMLCGVDQSARLEVVVLRRIVRIVSSVISRRIVVIVVVVALHARPRDDDAADLRVDVADARRRGIDHVSVVGLTVAVFELAAGDAARKRVVTLACAVGVAAAYDRGDRTGAGQIAVDQTAVVADEEADHTARNGDAVSPSGECIAASSLSVGKCADRDAVTEVDICVADRAADQNSRKGACDRGVLPRSRISIRLSTPRFLRVDVACLLPTDKVVRHIDPDIVDRAEVGARDDAVSGNVLRLVAGKKRHSSGDVVAVYDSGHSHIGRIINHKVCDCTPVGAGQKTCGPNAFEVGRRRMVSVREIGLDAVIVGIQEHAPVHRQITCRVVDRDLVAVAVQDAVERA